MGTEMEGMRNKMIQTNQNRLSTKETSEMATSTSEEKKIAIDFATSYHDEEAALAVAVDQEDSAMSLLVELEENEENENDEKDGKDEAELDINMDLDIDIEEEEEDDNGGFKIEMVDVGNLQAVVG